MTIPLAGWVGRRHGKGWCELICAPFLETPTHLLTPYSCSNSTLLETILALYRAFLCTKLLYRLYWYMQYWSM